MHGQPHIRFTEHNWHQHRSCQYEGLWLKENVTGPRTQFHDEERKTLQWSLNIIRVTKSEKVTWAAVLQSMSNERNYTCMSSEKLNFMHDFRLPPLCRCYLRSAGKLRSLQWQFLTEDSGQPLGPIFKHQEIQINSTLWNIPEEGS